MLHKFAYWIIGQEDLLLAQSFRKVDQSLRKSESELNSTDSVTIHEAIHAMEAKHLPKRQHAEYHRHASIGFENGLRHSLILHFFRIWYYIFHSIIRKKNH